MEHTVLLNVGAADFNLAMYLPSTLHPREQQAGSKGNIYSTAFRLGKLGEITIKIIYNSDLFWNHKWHTVLDSMGSFYTQKF